jgi:hypothetical protein
MFIFEYSIGKQKDKLHFKVLYQESLRTFKIIELLLDFSITAAKNLFFARIF